MRGTLKLVFPAFLVCLLATALNVFCAEKHECSYCHVTLGESNEMQLSANVAELRVQCHAERKSLREHKVDIIPHMKVRDLPLSKDGLMICITCHDPHGKSGYPMLLRAKPSELCLKCHFR